ncbi:MAG TPA: GNAT family N-acetyltransferase [Bacteriovoracaceae bacterium]|nr:GNAT family N-acetyltransferase [Bacteriovoracaceae bacterium]
MNSIVRSLTPSDLEWVISADQDFPHPWDSASWNNLAPYMHCFVLQMESELGGYILFQHLEGDERAHLLKIYLTPAHRNKGLADLLFSESVQKLGVKEIFLEVGESNVAAVRFYERMGFNKIHLAKGFYSNGENAWIMTLIQ